jgi:putative heme-binding domain-containing protein
VSKLATELLDKLNPMAKAKNEAIAKLIPSSSNRATSRKARPRSRPCAPLPQLRRRGRGYRPGLTGMGAHARANCSPPSSDPNREVDPSFVTWNLEMKDGQFLAGIIARENPASIILKTQAGQQEVKVADIKNRVNTGRSLMPEGLEGLGGEQLRDIIAYMQSVDGGKFRAVDLKDVFTADTRGGSTPRLRPSRTRFRSRNLAR